MSVKRVVAAAIALVTSCVATSASAANLIVNGGFEDGTYTSTISGNTNASVPVGWTPNAGFDLATDFDRAYQGSNARSGNYFLLIGDYDYAPVAALSQTIADVAGSVYTADFYVLATRSGDTAANFTASIDGVSRLSLSDTINSYTEETFTFVGTGSDTLTLAANTNPGYWYVDDVTVTGEAVSAAPEPSTWALMFAGVAMTGAALRLGRRRQRASLAL